LSIVKEKDAPYSTYHFHPFLPTTGEQIKKAIEEESPSENPLLLSSKLEQLKEENSLYRQFFANQSAIARFQE